MSTINLLPEEYLTRRRQKRANMLCLSLFVVVMIGVVAATFVSHQRTVHSREVAERVQQEYEDAAKLIAQMQQLEAEKRQLQKKAEATADLMEKVPRSTLLAVVADALPEHASLMKVDMLTQKVQPQSEGKQSKYAGASAKRRPAETVVVVRITGLAGTDVDVARFIAEMARSPLTRSVDLVYSQEKKFPRSDDPVREFQIRMELDPKADALDLTEGRAAAPPDGGPAPARTMEGAGA